MLSGHDGKIYSLEDQSHSALNDSFAEPTCNNLNASQSCRFRALGLIISPAPGTLGLCMYQSMYIHVYVRVSSVFRCVVCIVTPHNSGPPIVS